MTKVLNLDSLETNIEKVIQVDGVEHVMRPLSVEEFVENMKELEAIQKGGVEIDPSEAFERSLTMILRAFPTLSEDRVRKMNVTQVDAIFAFVQGENDEELKRASSEGN